MSARVLSRRALLAGMLGAGAAQALGRIPYGSVLRLKLPWPLDALDPHALDDGAAALLGHGLCDPLFDRSDSGQPYPALADSLPETAPGGVVVRLRPGIVTAAGRALTGRDVVFSLLRCQARGAAALLASFGRPEVAPGEPLRVLLPGVTPEGAARALSSPLTAIVPRGFVPTRPDGTGPFRIRPRARGWTLERNLNAARGAALLQSIEVEGATTLAEALRAFEAGDADVGWLGAGLHRPRQGAVAFEAEALGWVVLRTGADAGPWGAPGVAQQLVDASAPGQFEHLGVRALPPSDSGTRWGGPATELLVRRGASHLTEIARTLAGVLGHPGHEVEVVPVDRAELARRRETRRYALMLDFVRPAGFDDDALALSLLTAEDPELARRPPKGSLADPRNVTRSLRLGVLGALRHAGSVLGRFRGLSSWKLGSVWDSALAEPSR